MISLPCTQCRQILEMDEAFAGGVCRCQFCGTIQTVPSSARHGKSGSSDKPGKSGSSKALYKKTGAEKASASNSGTQLDPLSEIAASSGLTRGSLSKPLAGQGTAVKSSSTRLIAIIGAILVLVVIAIVFVMTGSDSEKPGTTSANGPIQPAPVIPETTDPAQLARPAVTGPAFADIPLPTGVVVYLIDRSQANDESLDAVKAAVYKSARSLGQYRRFQIIFWHRADEGVVAYPEDQPTFAAKDQVDAAVKRFEDVIAYGNTDLKPSLEKALKAGPASIVLTTAKGFQLDDDTVTTVNAMLKGKSVKIHTISLADVGSPAMKQIAERTHGSYRPFQANELRRFAQ